MIVMAKKRKADKYVRGRDTGEVGYVTAEVDPEVAKALERYCTEFGVKKRFVVEQGIKAFLEKQGFWPPGEQK